MLYIIFRPILTVPTKGFNQSFLSSLLLASLLLLSVFSCVSVKNQKYMQDQKADIHANLTDTKSFNLSEPVYHLKPDDIISVEVFSLTQEKFNFLGSTPKLELTVDKDGNVELPVVGNIKVMGLTLQQTQDSSRP